MASRARAVCDRRLKSLNPPGNLTSDSGVPPSPGSTMLNDLPEEGKRLLGFAGRGKAFAWTSTLLLWGRGSRGIQRSLKLSFLEGGGAFGDLMVTWHDMRVPCQTVNRDSWHVERVRGLSASRPAATSRGPSLGFEPDSKRDSWHVEVRRPAATSHGPGFPIQVQSKGDIWHRCSQNPASVHRV